MRGFQEVQKACFSFEAVVLQIFNNKKVFFKAKVVKLFMHPRPRSYTDWPEPVFMDLMDLHAYQARKTSSSQSTSCTIHVKCLTKDTIIHIESP